MVKVIFEYDSHFQKWEVYVEGANSQTEAIQAFNAVVLTTQDAIPSMETNRAELVQIYSVGNHKYKISVGVLS